MGKHPHRVMRGQRLDERAKAELLDGSSEDEPTTRREHRSDLRTDDVGTCEMTDEAVDEDHVEGVAGERELLGIGFHKLKVWCSARAVSIMAGTRSTPVTVAPRAAIIAVICPGPQPTSSARQSPVSCAASRRWLTSRDVSFAVEST